MPLPEPPLPTPHIPDLARLSPEARAALARCAKPVTFPPGEQILRDDTPSDALYLVLEGFLEVTWRGEDRRAPLYVELGPGGIVGQDAIGGSGSVGAWTVGEVRALRLSRQDALALAAAHADFGELVQAMAAVQGRRAWLVRQLRRSPLFRHVAPGDLTELLPGSHLVVGAPGQRVVDGRQPLDGLLVVLEGDVLLQPIGKLRVGRLSHDPRPVALGVGAIIGDTALCDDGPLLQDVEAGAAGCRLLRLSRAAFHRAFMGVASFRRGVLASPALRPQDRQSMVRAQVLSVDDAERRPFVGLVTDKPDMGAETLLRWLGEASAREWGDRVVQIVPDPSFAGAPERLVYEEYEGGGWFEQLRVPARPGTADTNAIGKLLLADVRLLDISRLSMAEALAWLPLVHRVVAVLSEPYRPPQGHLPSLLGDRLPIYTAVVPAAAPGPDEVVIVPHRSLRLHRDVVTAARRGGALQSLPADLKEQVHRWMRGVSGRRFGVALGGGGALSWAEAAVLQRIHEAGIPVDMVAGVSGGAVVGAFYTGGRDLELPAGLAVPEALRPLPGLALLAALGKDLERAQSLGILSGAFVARFLERNLPHLRLEDMVLPFFPVAVDADQAVQASFRSGPLAFGTRASASFPGTFTPTTLDLRELASLRRRPWRGPGDLPSREPHLRPHTRWLDGGLLNNIPDDSLYLEGAQLVLACNVVPAPQPRAETSPRFFLDTQARLQRHAGSLARFVRELDPVVRFDDLLRAVYMLLFQPADWAARTADVKYEASTVGFTFLEWSRADEIRKQALEGARGEAVDSVVAEVRRHRQTLRWARGDEQAEAAFAAELARDLGIEEDAAEG